MTLKNAAGLTLVGTFRDAGTKVRTCFSAVFGIHSLTYLAAERQVPHHQCYPSNNCTCGFAGRAGQFVSVCSSNLRQAREAKAS